MITGAGALLLLLLGPVPGVSQLRLAARPLIGHERVSGEDDALLDGHARAEFTVYGYEHRTSGLRVGAGFGWVSYGLADPSDPDRTLNSARAHFAVGLPWEIGRGVRAYSEGRVAMARLRSEKADDYENVKKDEAGKRAEEHQVLRADGRGVEFVGGLEGPLPRGWLQGFNWTVSFHYGIFDTRSLTVSPTAPPLNSARTRGWYLGAFWYP